MYVRNIGKTMTTTHNNTSTVYPWI